MTVFQPNKTPTPYEPTHRDDPLEAFASCNLEPVVMQMLRHFGGETKETAFVERVFNFDPDCDLVWQTQFVNDPRYPSADFPRRALQFGVYALFGGPQHWSDPPTRPTPRRVLRQWRDITRSLLEIEARTLSQDPWLYGWAVFGADLYEEAEGRPLTIADPKIAQAVCGRQRRTVRTDELPLSLDELLTYPRMSPALALRLERRLIRALLNE